MRKTSEPPLEEGRVVNCKKNRKKFKKNLEFRFFVVPLHQQNTKAMEELNNKINQMFSEHEDDYTKGGTRSCNLTKAQFELMALTFYCMGQKSIADIYAK